MNAKDFPFVAVAPRIVLSLPADNPTECFRRGWASGQLEMLKRYMRRKGEPLTDLEETRLYNLIMEGRKRKPV